MSKLSYWERRAAARMVDYIKDAENTAAEMKAVYYRAADYFSKEAADAFSGFEKAFELSEKEAKVILSGASSDISRASLLNIVQQISDPNEKEKAIAAVNSSAAYLDRINHVEKLQAEAEQICQKLYKAELGIGSRALTNGIENAYDYTIFDIHKGTGLSGAFEQISTERINKILSSEWKGDNYSGRVWSHTQDLADELKLTLLTGVITGSSEDKMTDAIMERFSVTDFKARRLVRTEMNRVANAAELDGYIACGIKSYEFSACLDNDTSDMCREKNGNHYLISEAVPGENLPPLHGFCRSTTLPDLPSEDELDKIIGDFGDEITADIDYDNWKAHLEQMDDGKYVYHNPESETNTVVNEIGSPKVEEASEWDKIGRYEGEIPVDKSVRSDIIKESVKDRIYDFEKENAVFDYSYNDVENELLKSDAGKHAASVIEDKNITIAFDYSRFDLFDSSSTEVPMGISYGKDISVYVNNHNSLIELAQTIIHEATHIDLNTKVNTQKEEAFCKLQELLHEKSSYSYHDLRKIIREVKNSVAYESLKWRDRNGI